MKILFISQLYDPEYSIKGHALMKHWVDQGHEVEVITTFPNYPVGKVYDGYKVKLVDESYEDQVKITRVWSHISHSKSKLSRAWSYISFTLMALLFALKSKNVSVVYTYHPQSTTGLIGMLMTLFKRVPYITDVQDLWPDSLTATGLGGNKIVTSLIGGWCRLVYKCSSHVVVLSEGFKKTLIERGVNEDKIDVVYNWCPEEALVSSTLEQSSYSVTSNRTVKLAYAGNLGAAQDLKSVVQAMGLLSDVDVHLSLIGGGVEREALEQEVKDLKLQNVSFLGYVPPKDLFSELVNYDALLVHLRDEPLFKITIPSKTQSYTALAKPIIMAVSGETQDIIREGGCGYYPTPSNPESIANAIRELSNDRDDWASLGSNSRKTYLSKFSLESGYRSLDSVLKKAVSYGN